MSGVSSSVVGRTALPSYPEPVEPLQEHRRATDASRYRAELRRVLDTASPDVARRLAAIRDSATERTDGVVMDVFPDQDGEGTFAVWARFEGGDAFALDRRLGDERQLLAVVRSEHGWTPPYRTGPPPGPPRTSGMSCSMSSPNGSTRSSRPTVPACTGRSPHRTAPRNAARWGRAAERPRRPHGDQLGRWQTAVPGHAVTPGRVLASYVCRLSARPGPAEAPPHPRGRSARRCRAPGSPGRNRCPRWWCC